MNDHRWRVDVDAYPYFIGRPLLSGKLRSRPEDFRVDELLGFEPDDDGPHRLLKVEKTGQNTDWVAKRLAAVAGVKLRDVGYSGMKDRHAVTTQWFSLPAPRQAVDYATLAEEGIRVLEDRATRRKLRRGAHRANRFVIVLRDVKGIETASLADLESRIEKLRKAGVPNWFGAQRFGRNGDNVTRALDGARGGIYISSLRSYLFNAVLARRVTDGTWNRLLDGEAVQLEGSNSFFLAESGDVSLQQRLADFDIHPSGPLWGTGESPVRGEVARLENEIIAPCKKITDALSRERLRPERRALRLGVRDMTMEHQNDTLTFGFELGTGAFATSVLRELVNAEEHRPTESRSEEQRGE